MLSVDDWYNILSDPEITKELSLTMLQALYEQPKQAAAASELGRILGFNGRNTSSPLTLEVGRFAKRISKKFDIGLKDRQEKKFKYWDLFFNGYQEKNLFIWKLRPEISQALELIKIAAISQSYIYTWNPNKWHWDDLAEAICRINSEETYVTRWSCGNTKKIEKGDRFFLMRLGSEPKGIMGCGTILSQPYEHEHWDNELATTGKTALRTDLAFEVLSDQPLIELEELQERYPDINWTPHSSGTSIPSATAGQLALLLSQHAKVPFAQTPSGAQLYSEGLPRQVTITTYDRNPEARRACIRHHVHDCAVCGFNFSQHFGELGEGFIEVHHLRPLGEIAQQHELDPIRDLRPVCANCHRMLHRNAPAYSIEELQAIRQNRNRQGQQ